eukprot:CAMPEP_0196757942 /NCGR_PEP_ID=MMETSP1091-20130531/103926_1 /TAXON_ID=302021 /ORGANISM="Rhodomonas sp., Strain CCMP768" /LENGTH=190 /DNA_ID=CAMNT_0042106737 /DNA_START=465 /DNA_END=1035 /DNA_ORIENTATION=-
MEAVTQSATGFDFVLGFTLAAWASAVAEALAVGQVPGHPHPPLSQAVTHSQVDLEQVELVPELQAADCSTESTVEAKEVVLVPAGVVVVSVLRTLIVLLPARSPACLAIQQHLTALLSNRDNEEQAFTRDIDEWNLIETHRRREVVHKNARLRRCKDGSRDTECHSCDSKRDAEFLQSARHTSVKLTSET